MAENTEYCGCPEGYIQIGELCYEIQQLPATVSSSSVPVAEGHKLIVYGGSGANFYESTVGRPLPISATGTTLVDSALDPLGYLPGGNGLMNGLWASQGSINYGRLNRVGIWATPNNSSHDNIWYGFSVCVDVPETKVYSIGFAADNRMRFRVNGNLVAQFDQAHTWNFNYWHVIPIQLNAGLNTIHLEGYNDGAWATFGAEVYDATPQQLMNIVVPPGATPEACDALIEPYTIFSTKDMIGSSFHTATNGSGWSCPDGYALSFCEDGEPACVLRTEVPFIDCNKFILTDCQNPDNTLIVTSVELALIIRNGTEVISIEGYPGCWVFEPINTNLPAIEITIVDEYVDCYTCLPKCYLLEDCEGIKKPKATNRDLSAYGFIKWNGTCWSVTEQAQPCDCLVEEFADFEVFDTCEDCLYVPPTTTIEISEPFIKPGFKPNDCDPVTVVRIKCEYGDAVYKDMVSKRYGIEMCCHGDLEKMWVKYQKLNLDLITSDCPIPEPEPDPDDEIQN
jgi:hypothetical protein